MSPDDMRLGTTYTIDGYATVKPTEYLVVDCSERPGVNENHTVFPNACAGEEDVAALSAGVTALGIYAPWATVFPVPVLGMLFCRSFPFRITVMDGSSMYDTLNDGELLLVNVLDARLRLIQRDDVVISHYPHRGNTNFVRRVVAQPGDFIYREHGVTHVMYEVENQDGSVQTVDEMLDEKMSDFFLTDFSDDYPEYKLRENEYFIVGDDRYNSHDSRDWNDYDPTNDVGPITADMIVGKACAVIWPFDNMRTVRQRTCRGQYSAECRHTSG